MKIKVLFIVILFFAYSIFGSLDVFAQDINVDDTYGGYTPGTTDPGSITDQDMTDAASGGSDLPAGGIGDTEDWGNLGDPGGSTDNSGENWWSGSGGSGGGYFESVGSGGGSGFNIPSVGLPSAPSGIGGIIENIAFWLLALLGFLGIVGFVVSGIMYLLSAGSDEAIKRAKKAMTASIIGVIVGLAGVVVVQAIDAALRAYQGF